MPNPAFVLVREGEHPIAVVEVVVVGKAVVAIENPSVVAVVATARPIVIAPVRLPK